MYVIVLLIVVSSATAAVPMAREQDPLIISIDDVEGLLYEVPDYEEPQLIEHQLSSFGAMPVFTLLDTAMKSYKNKEVSDKAKVAEAKKSIDDIIDKLQSIRSKLEKGNSNIYADLEKSIQSLKRLGRSFRPDILQVLGSLEASMSFADPIAMPLIKKFSTTIIPELQDKLTIQATPEMHGIKVRVISKSVADKKADQEKLSSDVKEMKFEKSIKMEKSIEGKPKFDEPEQITKENIEITKAPSKLDTYKHNKNVNEDTENFYQPNWSWKIEEAL